MKLFLHLGIAFAFIFSARQAFAQPNEEAFTKTFLQQLQSAVPSHRFEYVAPLELKDSTSGSTLYLDRLFGYIAANPKDSAAAQQSYVSQLSRAIAEAGKPISKQDVRLAIRNVAKIKSALDAMGPGSKPAYPKNLTGDLVVLPVIDTPSTVRFVSEKDLSLLGLTEDEAVECGMKNLRAIQKPLAEVAKIPPRSGFGIITEEYAASRLIFTSDWKSIEEKVGGNLIAMAPAYDTVIFGDGSTSTAVDALRTFGIQIAKQSQVPLSSTVVRLKGERWEAVE